MGDVFVIFGGPGERGQTSQSRRAYVRASQQQTEQVPTPHEVNQVLPLAKEMRMDPVDVTFTEGEVRNVQHPYDDALVVTLTLADLNVHRILVDNGSSVNVLYRHALDKMEIGSLKIRPVGTHLSGFTGAPIMPIGEITLPLSLGQTPTRVTEMIKFLVVDCPSAYNMILGRPSIHRFRAVPSTYHMAMKFPTRNGVDVVKRDQAEARQTYAMTNAPLLRNPNLSRQKKPS